MTPRIAPSYETRESTPGGINFSTNYLEPEFSSPERQNAPESPVLRGFASPNFPFPAELSNGKKNKQRTTNHKPQR